MVPGPRLNVEAKPTVMKILDTDRGPVLELGGWTGVKNAASTKVQIPPNIYRPWRRRQSWPIYAVFERWYPRGLWCYAQ